MLDVFQQALELRKKSEEFLARARNSANTDLRQRFSQLASRYDDAARTLDTLAIGTQYVFDVERRIGY